MTGPELIFLACLTMPWAVNCQKNLADCATAKRDVAVDKFVADLKAKDKWSKDVLNPSVPDWGEFILMCVKDQHDGKSLPHPVAIPSPSPSPSPTPVAGAK